MADKVTGTGAERRERGTNGKGKTVYSNTKSFPRFYETHGL